MTGAAKGSSAHALCHRLVSLALGHGIATVGIECVELLALNLLHHMGRDEPATVGDGGTQVGNLQWRGVDLALTDRDRDNGESVP